MGRWKFWTKDWWSHKIYHTKRIVNDAGKGMKKAFRTVKKVFTPKSQPSSLPDPDVELDEKTDNQGKLTIHDKFKKGWKSFTNQFSKKNIKKAWNRTMRFF